MFCLPFIKNTQVLVPGWEFSVFTHFFGDALTRGIVNFVLPFTNFQETQTRKKKKKDITRSYSRTRNLRGFLAKIRKRKTSLADHYRLSCVLRVSAITAGLDILLLREFSWKKFTISRGILFCERCPVDIFVRCLELLYLAGSHILPGENTTTHTPWKGFAHLSLALALLLFFAGISLFLKEWGGFAIFKNMA